MTMSTRFAALALALAAVASCAEVLSIDDIEIGEATSSGAGGDTAAGGEAAGGTGSTTSMVGGSGGAGGGAEDEVCTNGVDDNGDGLVDCADPLCVGYQCAAGAPAGWSGPYALHLDAGAAAACPASAPVEVLAAGSGVLDAPAASCSACSCVAPAGVACSIPAVEFYDNNNCSELEATLTVSMPMQCEPVSAGGINSVTGLPGTPSGGSCAASGGAATVEPAVFAAEARLCDGGSGAGCGADAVCIATPEPPYAGQPCISSLGDLACPAGPYTEKQLVFAGIDDDRGCTSCTCGGPSGVACTGTTTVYGQIGCPGGATMVPHDGSCVNTDAKSMIYAPDPPSGGSCPEQGGAPTGSAEPATPITICCVP
jgi:hypothetical protein